MRSRYFLIKGYPGAWGVCRSDGIGAFGRAKGAGHGPRDSYRKNRVNKYCWQVHHGSDLQADNACSSWLEVTSEQNQDPAVKEYKTWTVLEDFT